MNLKPKLLQKLSDSAFLRQIGDKSVWFEPLIFAYEHYKHEVESKLKQVGYHPIWMDDCEDNVPFLHGNENRYYHFQHNSDDQIHIHSLFFKEELARHEVLLLMDIFQNIFKNLFSTASFSGQQEHDKNRYILATITSSQEPLEILYFEIKESAYQENIAYEIFGVFRWESFLELLFIHSIDTTILTSSMAFIQAVYIPVKAHQGSDQLLRKMLMTNDKYRMKIAHNHEMLKEHYPLYLKTTSGSIKSDEVRLKTDLDENYHAINLHQLEIEMESILSSYDHSLYKKHFKLLLGHLPACTSINDIKEKADSNFAYVKIMWCGETDCLFNQKVLLGYIPYVIPFHQEWFTNVCPICQKEAHHTVYLRKTHTF